MNDLATRVVSALCGKTLVTAESCTGGLIGAMITSVPGSSAIYKGGIISYCNEIKEDILGVSAEALQQYGAVSHPVAAMMACGARKVLNADIAISVTGLAGPDGDDFGNPLGTVYIGYEDRSNALVKEFHFVGDREHIREQAAAAALKLILENI